MATAKNEGQEKSRLKISKHAKHRMRERGISRKAVEVALAVGWEHRTPNGKRVFEVGELETIRCLRQGFDISYFKGVTVVVDADFTTIVTVYRKEGYR